MDADAFGFKDFQLFVDGPSATSNSKEKPLQLELFSCYNHWSTIRIGRSGVNWTETDLQIAKREEKG